MAGDTITGAGVGAGIRWGVIDQGVQVFVRLGANIVLARLIAPRDFGVVGLAVVVVNFALVLSGLGLGSALIQRRALTPGHVTTAFTTSAGFGFVLAAAVAAASLPAAAFFREDSLHTLLPVLAITFVFRGFELIPNDILIRDLRFRSYYLSSTIATIASSVLALGCGFAGLGVWALVVMMFSESLLAAILAWVFAIRAGVWRPSLGFDRRSFHDLIGLSGYVTASQLVGYGNHNGDNLIVGRALGATALGYYGFAYRLMILPLQRFGGIISQSAFPAMARVQDDPERLRSGYVTATRYVATVCFPLTMGIAVAAPLAVPVVLGDQWRPAIPALQILALAGPLLSLNRLTDALFRSIGKAKWNFWLNLASLVVHIVAFLIGVGYGISGVAVAFVVSTVATIIPAPLMAARVVRAPWWFLARPIAPIAVATAAMTAVALGVLRLVPASIPGVVELGLVVALSGVAYVLPLMALAPGLLAELRSVLPTRKG